MPPGVLEDWSLGRRMSSDGLGAHGAVDVLSRMVVVSPPPRGTDHTPWF